MKKITAEWPQLLTYPTPQIGAVCGAIFTLMAVSQLSGFEDMASLVSSALPVGTGLAPVAAAILVVFEVFAVPFLLGMRLSPLMRMTSLACGVAAILYWFGVGIYNVMDDSLSILNVGLLGNHLVVPAGGWLLLFLIGFTALFLWYTLKYFKARPRHNG